MSSASIRCLGCLLLIIAVGLFKSCSATGSGNYNTIEITLTASNQCDNIEAAVNETLAASGIDVSNHTTVVEGDSCNSNVKKRNSEFEYDVIMQDKTSGSYDDGKTDEVREYICGICDAIKNSTLGASLKSINCAGALSNQECVVTPTPTPSTTTISMTSSVDTISTSDIVNDSTSDIIATTTTIPSPAASSSTTQSVPITIPSSSTDTVDTTQSVPTTIPSSSTDTVDTTQSVPSTTIPSSSTDTVDTTQSVPTTIPSSSTDTVDTTTIKTTTATPPVSSSTRISNRPTTNIPSSSTATTGTSSTPTNEEETETPEPSIAEMLTIVIPATVLGIVLMLSLIVICSMCLVFQFKRTKLDKDKAKHPPNVWVDTKPSMGNHGLVELKSENRRPMRPSRVSFVSKGNVVLQTLSHPLSIEELAFSLKNLDDLVSEYISVPPNLVGKNDIPVGAEEKNRYIDVLPNPNTRVPLFLKFGVAHSDYINANYIRGHRNQSKQYIATQGPLEETVNDFWRMVWEQKVPVIIMATELVERNMEKCFQYWPDQQGYGVTRVYGEFEVTLRKRNKTHAYTVTTFSVAHLERHVSREIVHYWFNGWPDHGVPSSSTDFIDFLLETRTRREGFNMPGPTLVHCSAGIGRTGVFIAADIGMKQLEENMTVDALKILATLRQDKGGMIQTKEQYIFLHKALNEYASRIGTVNAIPRFDSDEDGLNGGGFYDDDDANVTVTTFA